MRALRAASLLKGECGVERERDCGRQRAGVQLAGVVRGELAEGIRRRGEQHVGVAVFDIGDRMAGADVEPDYDPVGVAAGLGLLRPRVELRVPD